VTEPVRRAALRKQPVSTRDLGGVRGAASASPAQGFGRIQAMDDAEWRDFADLPPSDSDADR
jgi:hypothetical protein